ncbi:MAG: hypothetical protein CVU54_04005 [Deltaproteobacteria bacterium HGW-Deltaproteobacteria-12]|jgi:hypothetical protein|nr:MAG: hypothetical protein CVU54_04005 [Deltaproteobacteria bacterium HGW-Deltaproteobacteria-12]
MSVFEIIMLVCFGVSWPVSIYKSYVSRSTKGKSLIFLYIVSAGYVAGILHKIFYHFDGVIVFYIINLLLVIADIALFYRNMWIEKQGST